MSLKRPNEEEPIDGPSREVKKSRFQDGPGATATTSAPSGSEQLTPEQIREMMAHAQKMIEERKRSLQQPAALLTTPPVLASLPPAPIGRPASTVPAAPATMDERARKIAELQAQIQSKLSSSTALANLGLNVPKVPILPGIPVAAKIPVVNGSESNEPKPGPLILNAEGRTVDASGKEILLPQYTPTLKANIRAQKREVLKTHMGGKGSQGQRDDSGASLAEGKFFDPRVSIKSSARPKRSFHFHEQGKFQQVATRMRMKAQLDKLQNEISQIARKTGINSVTALALVAPRAGPDERKEEEDVPDLEWWDSVILQTRSYEVIIP